MYKRRIETLQLQMKDYVLLLILIGAGCVIGSLIHPFNNYCDYQDKIIEYGELIQRIIKDVTQILMGVIILLIARNIKRNKLFVVSTANMIGVLGCIVIFGSIAMIIAQSIWHAPYTPHVMENALGAVLIVISQILRIGIKIREENDLTI